ncbi:hypothetical protein ACH5RR_032924 [Cinchona calisaya]|uniref:F-box domain-containing protein n=1 Tax=Cinchona calisaya TaxID=153742 RepID=A0ABD2YNW9_9GENT
MVPSPFPRIPEEIIIANILPRLPVKTLFRFKCVCKSWQSSISSDKFELSTKGRERAIFTTSHTDQIICSRPYNLSKEKRRRKSIYSIDLHQLDPQEIPCPIKHNDYYVTYILGSCNGLLLISIYQNVYLWNPSTRCYRRIPHLNIISGIPIRPSGLWYDKSSNDYKALAEHNGDQVVAYLQRNKVTKINFPYEIAACKITRSAGLLVNGCLHWIAKNTSAIGAGPNIIVRFDISTYQFNELPLLLDPAREENNDDNRFILGLGVLDGCLCMCRDGKNWDRTEVLIMREYGVKESWTSLLHVLYWRRNMGRGPPGWLVPVLFGSTTRKSSYSTTTITTEEEDILVADGSEIWAYNLRYDSLKKIELIPYQNIQHGLVTYVESLASVL